MDIDRHMTWIKGHTPRNKRPRSAANEEIVQNIVVLKDKVREGKWTPKGRDDILAKAINKPEHPGRVRGVLSHVGIAEVFGKTAKVTIDAEKFEVIMSIIMNNTVVLKVSTDELETMHTF